MRKNGFTRGAALGGVFVTMLIVAATAFAGSGINGVFNLGVSNQVDQTTTLKGKVLGSQLDVTNTLTKTGSFALSATGGSDTTPALDVFNPRWQAANFVSSGGAPPFTVNSTAAVANLNADQLDGLNSTAFVGTSGKAADTVRLDGLDSTQFIRGTGETRSLVSTFPDPGKSGTLDAPDDSFFMWVECDLSGPGPQIWIELAFGVSLNIFVSNGSASPEFVQLADGDLDQWGAAPAGDTYTFEIQGGSFGVATIHAAVVKRPSTNDCYLQMQAVFNAGS